MQTYVLHYDCNEHAPSCASSQSALERAQESWSRAELEREERRATTTFRRVIAGAVLLGTLLGIRVAIGPVHDYGRQAPAHVQRSYPLPGMR